MKIHRTCSMPLMLLAAVLAFCAAPPAPAQPKPTPAPLPRVAPVDWSKIKAADFADDELDMPYFLAHLSDLANSIISEGENRGYISASSWRGRNGNRTFNARILENYLSLAWFYSVKRPWNVYYGDPALRARLEALLEFWLKIQNPDGRFSEYGPQQWNLPSTAFATKFMGRTLQLLKDGPPIDADLLKRVTEADRKAIVATLTRPELYAHGLVYTNQFANVWSGTLAYLSLHPDAELEKMMRAKLAEFHPAFQSPAGYYYENNGPDWGYNLGTEPTNLEAARNNTKDPELLKLFSEEEARYFDWLVYNAVPEPDGSGFVFNRAIETRGRVAFLEKRPRGLFSREWFDAEKVEMARPFCISSEEFEARKNAARAALEKTWPPRVEAFGSFQPYDFMARAWPHWLPTKAQIEEATKKLPYNAKENFNHQRTDSRFPIEYTFIRRPLYYAAFNSGQIVGGAQSLGLGLIWRPDTGAIMQSQTGYYDAAWGTLAAGASKLFEAQNFRPAFTIAGKEITPKPGALDLPDGELTVLYSLGEQGQKKVIFGEDKIQVSLELPGDYTENIPLLVGGKDTLTLKPGQADLGKLHVTFDPKVKASIQKTGLETGNKNVQIVHLEGNGKLSYAIGFEK